MADDAEPRSSGARTGEHGLGPHVVGQRIVVRSIVPAESGPTGGPAFTDVLGVCERWGPADVLVRRDTGTHGGPDGETVTIPIHLIVSGKPVPPRPSARLRVGTRIAHQHALAMWPDTHTEPLGQWLLRYDPTPGERVVARANSVLAVGDPAMPLPQAADLVNRWYRERDRPPWAQVEVDGEICRGLLDLGWRDARPGEAPTAFQLSGVSGVLRRLGAGVQTPDAPEATLVEDGDAALVTLGDCETVWARARAALDGDWVGVHDVWTAPEQRGRGLAKRVLADLLDWAASRGATVVYLQVREDNAAGLGMYERLGFQTHHSYRYLTAPPS